MKEQIIDGKTVTIYPASAAEKPIVYLNTSADEGKKIFRILQEQACPDFTLVTVCGIDWDYELTPWKAPAVFPGGTEFGGEGSRFLSVLTEKIVPQVESEITDTVLWRGIAGYSLVGLFAIYALYKTDLFSRAASMSGSLWFPDFKEFVLTREFKRIPECVYFSLGDKESRTRNPYLKTVQSNTEEIAAFFRTREIETAFERNPGNHHTDTAARSAVGIRWILEK